MSPGQSQTDNDDGVLTALILPGGGARGAYQVGVLRAIAEITAGSGNPFPVICGTSAGAINAALLASHAHEFEIGVERLEHFWSTMECSRVYRTDTGTVLKSGLRWALSLASGGRLVSNPPSLLDNQPLRAFLGDSLDLGGVATAIEQGALRGLAVTASGYTCASAISFFEAHDSVQPWSRARRHGQATRIGVPHLLASAALPLLFPAERIGNEYFGDGGMRMLAPLSPAIHLGAKRLLVISTRDEKPDPPPTAPVPYPSLGEIGGYLLDTIFMDTLNADLNRLRRINRTIELVDEDQRRRAGLQVMATRVVRPTRDLREVTHQHVGQIPRAVRTLLRALGGWGRDWRMASYLLFESVYCKELIRLGYEDGMAQRDELAGFLAGD
ncbi:MAG: patatin-like phospholipase family protein [Gammaproteobacteria bacterium]|nr:patatin-like phospholipase family protein [Gammaproteobacteria bacterium]MBT8065581.1 patatin-like phospholipase family protein [Gammaproteobacteria bacterium]NNK33328.1 patatin-like phospholipase family protein [Xanthomonadales bacterium]